MSSVFVVVLLIKKGKMGAIISRNMAMSLRMSAKSLGKGYRVRG